MAQRMHVEKHQPATEHLNMNTYRITRDTRSEADFANVVTLKAVHVPSIGSTFAKSAPVRPASKPRGFFARLLGL